MGDANTTPYSVPESAGTPGDRSVEPTKADDVISSTATRQVITSGSVSLTVDSPARAADDAARITESAGGHVDGRVERAAIEGRGGDAQLTLRIPSAQLTATLDALKKLGIVEKVSLTKQDVTATSLDLAARITALPTSVDRLGSVQLLLHRSDRRRGVLAPWLLSVAVLGGVAVLVRLRLRQRQQQWQQQQQWQWQQQSQQPRRV